MDELNLKTLEQIPIPEGLEERLSAKIDEWETHPQPLPKGGEDTYQDPVKAQQEAERALNMLAMNLNKGMGHLEKAKALSEKTEQSFYEKLKVMK